MIKETDKERKCSISAFIIFQCNGYDMTMVTHKKAVDYIKKNPVLNMLVARKGVTHT